MNKKHVRIVRDALGEVHIPKDAYWDIQTQRSLENFPAGDMLPKAFLHALALVKKACAKVNNASGILPKEKADIIMHVCDEILAGKLDNEFPLKVYQTGSATQTNMNMNEVITNRAHVLSGGTLTDERKKLHPNDDVNMSQSSNDVIPTAMHIAIYQTLQKQTIPAISLTQQTLAKKAKAFRDIVKSGRTHL
ncbi:MAG: lyase family protein, partial [Candidatus Levyibacteriota bacterium]